jgi:hypothetical protein
VTCNTKSIAKGSKNAAPLMGLIEMLGTLKGTRVLAKSLGLSPGQFRWVEELFLPPPNHPIQRDKPCETCNSPIENLHLQGAWEYISDCCNTGYKKKFEMTNAEVCRAAITLRGYTREEIAADTGYSVRVLHTWLSDKNAVQPRNQAVEVILKSCGFTRQQMEFKDHGLC